VGAELTLEPPLRSAAKRRTVPRCRDTPPARRGRKDAELEVEDAEKARERRPPPSPAGAVNAMESSLGTD
jgi:hypothetical protein